MRISDIFSKFPTKPATQKYMKNMRAGNSKPIHLSSCNKLGRPPFVYCNK